MERLIYELKILLFRGSSFKLTKREAQDLEHFCIFGVGVYIEPWFLSRLPTAAPTSNLKLLKLLTTFDSPRVSEEVVWAALVYLSEEMIALISLL